MVFMAKIYLKKCFHSNIKTDTAFFFTNWSIFK
jgi:hypothetical protein